MTVGHSLDGSGADALLPRGSLGASQNRPVPPPKSRQPVELGPRPPAWSRGARAAQRAHTAVITTITLSLFGLFAYLGTRPDLGNRHAWVEAERPVVELRLSLAELRAIISDYRVEHGAFPGCDGNGAADPRWFDRQWERAIERANAQVRLKDARLAPAHAPGGAPTNPVNGLASVRFLTAGEPWPVAADDTTGWIYKPSTGELRANCTGKAFGAGPAYWDL